MSIPSLTCGYCGRRFKLAGMCRAHELAELAIERRSAKVAPGDKAMTQLEFFEHQTKDLPGATQRVLRRALQC